MTTKKELIKEYREILNRLIEQKKLKYYPFKRDLKYFDKKTLKEGLNLHKDLLNKMEKYKTKCLNCETKYIKEIYLFDFCPNCKGKNLIKIKNNTL